MQVSVFFYRDRSLVKTWSNLVFFAFPLFSYSAYAFPYRRLWAPVKWLVGH